MTGDTRQQFNFRIVPVLKYAARLGITSPRLANRVKEINISLTATHQEAITAFQNLFPDKRRPNTGTQTPSWATGCPQA